MYNINALRSISPFDAIKDIWKYILFIGN
jgi:chromatin remodeling complex protein RSC6